MCVFHLEGSKVIQPEVHRPECPLTVKSSPFLSLYYNQSICVCFVVKQITLLVVERRDLLCLFEVRFVQHAKSYCHQKLIVTGTVVTNLQLPWAICSWCGLSIDSCWDLLIFSPVQEIPGSIKSNLLSFLSSFPRTNDILCYIHLPFILIIYFDPIVIFVKTQFLVGIINKWSVMRFPPSHFDWITMHSHFNLIYFTCKKIFIFIFMPMHWIRKAEEALEDTASVVWSSFTIDYSMFTCNPTNLMQHHMNLFHKEFYAILQSPINSSIVMLLIGQPRVRNHQEKALCRNQRDGWNWKIKSIYSGFGYL